MELDEFIELVKEQQGIDLSGVLTTADKIGRPERALEKQAIDDFMKRNPMAGGGRMEFDYGGIARAFNELIDEGKTTFKSRKELMDAIQAKTGKRPGGSFQASNNNYADLFKKITFTSPNIRTKQGDPEDYKINETQKKDLTKKVNKLNKKYKLDKKGIKVALGTTQSGNTTLQFQTNANVYGNYFKDTLGISTKKSVTPNISGLNELEGYLKTITKSDLFKNYDKSAAMQEGGVKSAKKQLENIGSKKPQVFDYLLNNQNATIEQIAKDLKLKEGVVKKNLQGLYTDIYKRYGDQGAVYLKEFDAGQLNSVHNTIKNTKVPLKDRVKELVIEAYKGDKNLKPLLEKIDKFYEVQAKVKKTEYGKFFAGNLDHVIPLNFIRELEQGADPMELIRIKPLPEFLNQRAFKAQFDKVLGAAYRTNNKKALEAIVTLQSYLPKEFGGITSEGKIIDYGAKPFTLKTSLSTTDFPEIYKRVFEFINNPDLQDTFDEVKVSFKSLKAQEKNILNQIQGYSKLPECMLDLAGGGRVGFKSSTKCITDGLNEAKKAAAAGDKKAARQLVNTAEAATKGRLLKNILGPGAILGELVFEGALIGNKVLGGKPADIAYAESYLSYLDPRKYSGQLDPTLLQREQMLESTADKNILQSGFDAQDRISAFNEARRKEELAEIRQRPDQLMTEAEREKLRAYEKQSSPFIKDSQLQKDADIISSEAFKDASNVAQEYLQGKAGEQMAKFGVLSVPQGDDADNLRRLKANKAMQNLYTQYSDDQLKQFLKQSLGTDDDELIDKYLDLTGVTKRITPAVTTTLSGLDVLRTGLQEQEALNRIAEAGGVANLAKGGRAGFKVGSLRKGLLALIDDSVKSTPKDTTPDLDVLIKKTLDEDFFDKKDRIIDNINAKIARARAKGLDSQEIGEGQIEFYDDITKSNFRTKTGPFFDYQKRKNKAGGGLLKQAGDRSGPPPESGPNSQGLQGLLNRVKKI